MSLDEVQHALKEMGQDDLARFREWFQTFDSAAWDRQIVSDAASGRLDALADEAIRSHRAGDTREL
ncbi:MAG: hypothetical protein AAF805_01655 [Planctomycetota bacterium]